LGGKPASSLGERFYEPTVLTNINESMMCYNEEIFGPVAVCIRQVSIVSLFLSVYYHLLKIVIFLERMFPLQCNLRIPQSKNILQA
jgi:hypothetical protein